MDEVQIKVQMEAIVIAFSLGLLLLMTLGLIDLFITLNQENWSHRHLFPILIAFYFAGLYFQPVNITLMMKNTIKVERAKKLDTG